MPRLSDLEKLLILVLRLEAATCLLENMIGPNLGNVAGSTNGVAAIEGAGLAAAGGTDQLRGAAASPEPIPEPLPPAIDDFDLMISGDVQNFVSMGEDIGGLVAEQVRL